jgi:hypothetical protein
MRWLLLVCAALLATPAPGHADAPELEIARGHFRRGAEHYANSRFTEAAAEFELARKELPLPEIDYNLGRAYEGAGDVDRSLAAYRRFLATPGFQAARDDVAQRVRLLEVASPAVHARLDRERGQERARTRWRRTYPAAIAVGVAALALGGTSAGLYPALLHERDQLERPCPPDCTGSYDRVRALGLATTVTFGVAIGLAAADVALWGVALGAQRKAR